MVFRFVPTTAVRIGLAALFTIVVSLSSIPAAPKEDGRLRAAREKVEGEWDLTVAWYDGEESRGKTRLTVRDGTYRMEFEPDWKLRGSNVYECDCWFELVEGRAVMHTKNRTVFAGFTRAHAVRVECDRLEVCFGLDEDRKDAAPKSFDGSAGSRQALLQFRRAGGGPK